MLLNQLKRVEVIRVVIKMVWNSEVCIGIGEPKEEKMLIKICSCVGSMICCCNWGVV